MRIVNCILVAGLMVTGVSALMPAASSDHNTCPSFHWLPLLGVSNAVATGWSDYWRVTVTAPSVVTLISTSNGGNADLYVRNGSCVLVCTSLLTTPVDECLILPGTYEIEVRGKVATSYTLYVAR